METHSESFGVTELFDTLDCVYELGVRVHLVRPELVDIEEPGQVRHLGDMVGQDVCIG